LIDLKINQQSPTAMVFDETVGGPTVNPFRSCKSWHLIIRWRWSSVLIPNVSYHSKQAPYLYSHESPG